MITILKLWSLTKLIIYSNNNSIYKGDKIISYNLSYIFYTASALIYHYVSFNKCKLSNGKPFYMETVGYNWKSFLIWLQFFI